MGKLQNLLMISGELWFCHCHFRQNDEMALLMLYGF
jgi:hypothetical protein